MQAVVQLNAPPNTPVFTLQARDPDTDHNIHYFIVRDRTGGRFEVDERSGVVRTRGTDLFQLDMEYVLYVKAEDQNGKVDDRKFQSTPEERLSIVGGKRAPQFYMPSYEAEIPENQKKTLSKCHVNEPFELFNLMNPVFFFLFTASFLLKPSHLPTEKFATHLKHKDKVQARSTLDPLQEL